MSVGLETSALISMYSMEATDKVTQHSPDMIQWKGTTYGAINADTLGSVCQVIQDPH